MINWKTEIVELISLMLSTIFFQGPLNFFLTGQGFKKSFKTLVWSIALNLGTWTFYRAGFKQALISDRVGLFLSFIFIANAAIYWLLLKFRLQSAEVFIEGKLWGWILFSPLLAIASVISTPLVAAIVISISRAF